MKKVLFTATVDSHILQFHIPYLKMFKEKGYEVHVATNGTEVIPYCDVKHVISFARSPIKTSNLKAIIQLRKIINENNFEIIHCHTPMGSVVTRIAAKKARKRGTRVIYTAHGFHFFKGAPMVNWLVFYPVEKYLSKYTDCLITINQEDYELAKRKFKKCKQIELVHGVGVDESKFDFEMSEREKHELRESLGLRDEDFVIIYVAELSKRKNQGMLIQAVKELIDDGKDNIKVILPGTDSMNGYYQKMAKNLEIEENIKFLGYRKDIPKLLKISDLYVSTAKQEGLPVNIMEAMCCGLPIIATDCRGNRDLIDECIEIGNVEKLKEDILQKKWNIKYDINSYSLKNISEQIKKIYDKMLIKKIIMLRSTAIKNDSRIQKEAKAIKENKNEVLIIGWDRENQLDRFEKFENIDIEFFRRKSVYGSGIKNLINLILFQMFLLNKLIKYRKKYDIVFSCDLDTGIISRIVSKIFRKRMIYDIYDYYIDCHNLPSWLSNFAERQEIKNINYADVTIICTEQRKEQINKAHPQNLIVIHNSPEIPKNITDMESVVQSKSNKLKIVYVGILQDDRMLCEVGEAIKKYPQYELHIGGFGKYEEYFKDLAKKHENIFFYGSLDYGSVLKLESECDILFATYNPKIKNHKYSAPNKLYEAMALGKPIIVCKNTGIDKIVEENKLGKVIDYDAEKLIRTLKTLENYNLKSTISLYESRYSWRVMKNRLLSIL